MMRIYTLRVAMMLSVIFLMGNLAAQTPTTTCTVSDVSNDGWTNGVAIWLNEFPGAEDIFVLSSPGTFTQDGNGNAHLTATVHNISDANMGFQVDINYINGTDWAGWSAQGRGYKDQPGIVHNNYLNWFYYELDNANSSLTGIGTLTGVNLSLTHAPVNYYYGLQVGIAGNLNTAVDGLGGWFDYTDGTGAYSGNGDVLLEGDCTDDPPLYDCPQLQANFGDACDDGSANTINDTVDTTCQCSGEFQDADGDGIGDADDQCPGFDDNLLGTACDDNDDTTENDTYTDCNVCQGTTITVFGCTDESACNYDPAANANDESCVYPSEEICDGIDNDCDGLTDEGLIFGFCEECIEGELVNSDADGDKFCDDEDSCPGFDDGLLGAPCDDGDPATDNDTYIDCDLCQGDFVAVFGCTDEEACNYDAAANTNDESCLIPEGCETCLDGEIVDNDADNDGTCDEDDLCEGPEPGSVCDDGDANTVGDVISADCICAGTSTFDCPTLQLNIGASCDDGNANTENDAVSADCNCEGTLIVLGCTDEEACNYNDAATASDDTCLFPEGCETCVDGAIVDNDADNDGTCDEDDLCEGPEPGTACDDGDANTVGDVISADCICAGTSTFDCPTLQLNIGASCDDGNANTENDAVSADCNCEGTLIVLGCTDEEACNYNDAATASDDTCLFPEGCETCVDGAIIDNDADNDGTCDEDDFCEGPEPGSVCDDGDANTVGDVIGTDCNCAGTSTFDCPALQLNIGASCDDGNANTENDAVSADCNCEGTLIVLGCTDEEACNYDADATQSDDSCLFPEGCEICVDGIILANDDDNDGTCNQDDQCPTGPEPGTACDDGDANTDGDVIGSDCNCAGTSVFDCPLLGLNIGDACDDGLASTENDMVNASCTCEGTLIVPGCTDNTACNFNAAATMEDGSCTFATGCETCENGLIVDNDADDDGTCDDEDVCDGPEPGTPCDDFDANTTGDVIGTDCNCAGTALFECPDLSANIGDACDDGDALTDNDTVQPDCSCAGESIFPCGPGVGLENIYVETYYISDANDATDEDQGTGVNGLPVGSTTYRVFVDMAEGWSLQSLFGNADHDFVINTSTSFFNNEDRGERLGEEIGDNRLDEQTTALDSWISVGGASSAHVGVPKYLDTDGSVVGGANNDGGTDGIAGGLLVNDNPNAGIPLTTADGLLELDPTETQLVGDIGGQLNIYLGEDNAAGGFLIQNGSYAALGGTPGYTDENMILIAQITTDGIMDFQLNFRLGGPGGVFEQYVHSDPQVIQGGNGAVEIECDLLTYSSVPLVDIASPLGTSIDMTSYPNPNNGQQLKLRLDRLPGEGEMVSMELSDIFGRTTDLGKFENNQKMSLRTIDFATELDNGLYFVTVRYNGMSQVHKILVSK